ncbi:ParA family protein (plasmid) [Natrinema zhouii]|uniref:ParA family protein n=1 Tax=Natrinema zhouii TaxID=1710539 RepID=UPI001D0017BE|nr:ParA family protein [Natrinema zhouii]UHQ98247.1 ParA family protein [Natrinema zhouii]
MISVVVYSESGGTFKTTTTANLAVSLERMGLDVCVIDLDPQEGNLTSLFDVGENRSDSDADNLVRHILEMPEGDFEGLIETSSEGVDVIPSHDMLGDFTSNLEQKIAYETGMKNMSRDEFPRFELLYDLLWNEQQLQDQYNAVLIDPNARAEDLLYNAIYALRTLVAPVKPAGKGNLSLDGLEEMVENMSDQLDIEVGLSCVVPTAIGQTNAHTQYTKQFKDNEMYSTPVAIPARESLMDAMWEARGSAYKVVEERWKTFEQGDEMVSEPGKRGVYDRELETLRDIYELAAFVATETFDAEIDPQLTLDIDDHGERTFTIDDAEREVTA